MFQIITTNTLPDIYIEDKQSISIPCFYLTNDSSSTSTIELSNFTPMFVIESSDEEVVDIEDFSYVLSTIPSQYQMLEIDLDILQPLDDIYSLYINGSKYQSLLGIENLILYPTQENTEVIEEREST